MLFWRIHRCARIVFSLGFHLGKMTPSRSASTTWSTASATSATTRRPKSAARSAASYGPLYQAAYMLGGLQFRALRKELVDSGKMTDRDFHDAILKENSMPVAMVRAALTKQPLSREGLPAWKFYELNSTKAGSTNGNK